MVRELTSIDAYNLPKLVAAVQTRKESCLGREVQAHPVAGRPNLTSSDRTS